MNNLRQLFLSLFLLLTILPIAVNAQTTYPVQANVYLTPPYSNYLSDYYTTSKEKLVVTLLNRDQLRPTLDVRLRVWVTAVNGLKIQSREEINYPTITLDAGIPTRLTQDDLAPYFQPRNINTSGSFNQGKLPEGMIEFTFQVVEKHTGKVLSAPATGRVWLSSQKPPILRLPSNNEYVAFRDPFNLKFQWEPLHKNISQVEYEFELKELPNTGVAPQSAFLYAIPIYQERLVHTYLMYNGMMPPLDPDKTYAWRVRAIAKDGVDDLNMFDNSGYSEVYCLRTTGNCQPPFNCTADLKDRSLTLNWIPSEGNNEYLIQYRLKNDVNAQWKEDKTYETQRTLYSMQRGATYEFRVGSICTAGQPVFTPTGEITIPAVDSARLARCGIPGTFSLDNKEPIESLKAGDVVMVNDYPMTLTQVSGGGGSFSGEGWIPVNWLLNTKWQVEFDNITVNTDKQLIGGSVRAKYDETESQIANVDEITSGGHENTRDGILFPDYTLEDRVIPPNPTFDYDPESGELTIYTTDGQKVGETVKLKNDGKEVFPITIKDKEGNIYQIDQQKDENGKPVVTEDGKPKLESNYLGKQGEALPDNSFNKKALSEKTAIVYFEKGKGKYAFDEWRNEYKEIVKIRKEYDRIGESYYAPWKLIPAGESDKILARIEIEKNNPAGINPDNIVFTTIQGTRFDAKSLGDNLYELTLVAGQDKDVQEIYALHPKKDSKSHYYTLGKLNVVTYQKQEHKVVLVPINGKTPDKNALKKYLDEVYNPIGVTWQVDIDNSGFIYTGDLKELMKQSSGWFSAYNDKMDALNAAFKAHKQQSNSWEKETCYFFVLDNSGNKKEKGFMPRGKQFGYLFTNGLDDNKKHRVVAHELGHGRWKLVHPFDQTYGKKIKEDDKFNLMSYGYGTNLAKWQWEQIVDQAWFVNPTEGDDKGMIKAGSIAFIDEDVNNPTKLKFADLKCKRFACSGKGIVEIDEKHLGRIKSVELNDNGLITSIIDIDNKIYKISYAFKEGKITDANGSLVIEKFLLPQQFVRFDELHAMKASDLPKGISRTSRITMDSKDVTAYSGLADNSEYVIPVNSYSFKEDVEIAIINDSGNPVCHTITKKDCEKGIIKDYYIPFNLTNEDRETFTFITPSGEYILLPKEIENVEFYYNLSRFENVEIVTGALKSFKHNDVTYEAKISSSTSFDGYKSENGKAWNMSFNTVPDGYIMALPDKYDYILYKFGAKGNADKQINQYNSKQSRKIVTEKDFPINVFNENNPSVKSEIYIDAGLHSIKVSDLEKDHLRKGEILAVYKIAQIKELYPIIYENFEDENGEIDEKSNSKEYYLNTLEALKSYCAKERNNFSNSIENIIKEFDTKHDATSYNYMALFGVRENLSDVLNVLSVNDLVNLSLEERIKALTIIVGGGTQVSEKYEDQVIKIISSTPAIQIDALHDELVKKSGYYSKWIKYTKEKALIKLLVSGTDDSFPIVWTEDNYKALCLAFTKQCYQSSKFVEKLNPEKYDQFVINQSYRSIFEAFFNNGGYSEKNEHLQEFSASINENGTIALTHKFVNGWSETEDVYVDDAGVVIYKGTYTYYPIWSDEKTDTFSPFDPIYYVNSTDLSMLSDIGSKDEIIPVPAILVLYADDKAFNQTASDITMTAIDVASIATGTAAIAKGVRGAYLAWTIADITNSTVNLAANASGLAKDPNISELLSIYNLTTLGVSGGRMTVQMYRSLAKSSIDPSNVRLIVDNINSSSFSAAAHTAEDLGHYRKLMMRMQNIAQKRGNMPNIVLNCTKAIEKLDGIKTGNLARKITSTDELIKFLDSVDESTTVTQLEERGIKVFFRGTTRSADGTISPGNPNSQRYSATSTSTDPGVSIVFMIENITSNSSRKAVLQIATPSDLRKLPLHGPNNRFETELEVIFEVTPTDYSNFVRTEIPLEDALKVYEDMTGIKLPNRINGVTRANEIVDELPKMNLEQAEQFYREILKYNIK